MRDIPPVTQALLIANVAVFLLQQVLGPMLIANFALWPLGGPAYASTAQGIVEISFMPWQLVTYGFLHGGMLHLAMNCLALYMFGGAIEQALESRPFVIYYATCVIGAALLQLATMGVQPPQGMAPTVGASGGVYGLLLAYGMLFPRRTIMLLIPPIPMPAWLFVILFGVIELFQGLARAHSPIAHFAHLGGMLAGLLLLQYWRGKLPIKPKRRLML
ncbi:MAG TPA: rhomboid family intramembrane serine protease [Candidatus Saccharimonadia bacterium]|nr:rhomboid family intramembrane serine protease [Candidatus Saccharimonadia bacterium]